MRLRLLITHASNLNKRRRESHSRGDVVVATPVAGLGGARNEDGPRSSSCVHSKALPSFTAMNVSQLQPFDVSAVQHISVAPAEDASVSFLSSPAKSCLAQFSQFLSLKLLSKRARVRLSPAPLNLDAIPGKAHLFAVANSK